VAESTQSAVNPREAGPEVAGDETPSVDTFNGPAVLSRSYTIDRPLVPKEIRWSWTAGSTESWTTGLIAGTATPGAVTTSGASFGVSPSFSLSGRHYRNRDQFGLAYTAAYSLYSGASRYNGLNQNLALDYARHFTRGLSVNLSELGSIVSANYALQNPLTMPGVSVANLSLAASPSLQVLDQRTRQFQTMATVTWQKSARLSFSWGGGFFAVDRSGAGLAGNVGYQAQADVTYRYTGRTTIGMYYSYSSYIFPKHESLSDSNTEGLIFSYAFNRVTQLRLRGGISRLETLAYTLVPINPVIAAVIGQTSGIADIYSLRWTSDISAQFVRDLGHSRTFNVSFARGSSPGNGMILGGIQEVATAAFSARLLRRYLFSVTAGKTILTSQAQNTGNYSTDLFGMGLSRPLPRGVETHFNVSYSRYTVTGMPGIQSQFTVSSGVTWGPGPGKLW
jgi:hypothetical protein